MTAMPPFPQGCGELKGGSQVYVRLTCKLANCLDGIDVTDVRVGEVMELSAGKAASLIAEGWAEPISEEDTEVRNDSSTQAEAE